ncbi:MAG: N-acetylmuramoyl-L-alanine amidase [Clostridia bacterium]|nr:N-acetylmuramoyl-L-alanine amidase [Clostridia bacterium]
MGKKIYLSPSNQDGNLYAYGSTNEMEQCNRIADAAKTALERCGFTVKKAAKGQAMSRSITESNAWGADLHLPIHTNAGGGNGTMCMVYSKSAQNMQYAAPIYQAVQAVTPGNIDYGVREMAELAELNSTNCVAVYTEVDFHDNKTIAKWLIENSQTVGEALAQGVCKAYGVTYQAPDKKSERTTSEDLLYRVQVGAFAEKKNADEFLKQLRSAGFRDAFITGGKQ